MPWRCARCTEGRLPRVEAVVTVAASFPTRDDSSDAIRLKTAALAALCFHAFFAMTGFGGQAKPEYGAIIALLLLLANGRLPWQELARQPVARWLVVFTAFLVAHAAYAANVLPAIGYSKQLTAAAELVRLGAFSCVIGWWLSRMPRAIPALFGLMVAGLLVGVALRMNWASLPLMWEGLLRPKFGIPENLSGMLAALGSWLSLCLLLRAWNAGEHLRWRYGLLVACLLGYIASFCVLLFSQSRGAWLAFAAIVLLTALARGYRHLRHGRGPMSWPSLASVAVVTLLLVWGANGIVAKRFAGAEQLLPEVVADDDQADAVRKQQPERPQTDRRTGTSAATDKPPAAPKSLAATDKATEANNVAVSVRLTLYELGVERWQQHWLLGWGLRSTSALIASSGLDLRGQRHAHLHSAYLDALVGMGAVGTALLALLLLLLLRELWLAWRDGAISEAEFWTVAGSAGIVLVANGFDSLLWRHATARAPLELVFGCCVAYGLIRRRRAAPGR